MFPFHSSKGVLGMNARNLLYIKPFNPRKAVAFADDKLKTKAFLAARGIPVARIYGRIENRAQLKVFDFSSLPDQCVLKPNYGFGGEGIMVLKGRDAKGQFLEQGRRAVSDQELREHIEDILDGKFSVNGMTDTAFFEKILISHPALAPFRPAGLPDVRIVVFNLVPVMAMLRVPTAESHGKANLHMGGVGIGIDIAKGITTHAAQYNRIITELPHGVAPEGHEIPYWEEMLLIASKIQYVTNIGYLAVDLTLDADMGPALLEVNARAGLTVQVANLAPLRDRLERVEGLSVSTPEKGVRIAQELFGEKTRFRDDDAHEKPILGTREVIAISGTGAAVEVPSFIAPNQERSVFSAQLLRELKRLEMVELASAEEDTYRVKFTLGGRKIQTVIRAGEVPEQGVRAIIGRRDLAGFLIDPSKTTDAPSPRGMLRDNSHAIDRLLSQADRDLLLLKYLKPKNLGEQRQLLLRDHRYNPIFTYPDLTVDMVELEQRLLEVSPDDSPLGLLFRKKRRELLHKMNLLRARGDARRITEASASLFGSPSSVLLTAATSFLKAQVACDLPPPESEMLAADDVVVLFQEVLDRYGLHEWKVSVRPNLVADCTVGGHSVYLRKDAFFSKEHVEALVAHEIETHVLTAENGEQQPFALFRTGFASYLDTQEGLAIYNQNRILSHYHDKRFGPARNVLAIAFALEHSFAETRAYLEDELGYKPDKAISKAIDVKRGIANTAEAGAFSKGLVYFRGLRAIEHYLAEGGDMKRLYVGKVALEDLDVVDQIPGILPPILVPTFLRPPKNKTRSKKTE